MGLTVLRTPGAFSALIDEASGGGACPFGAGHLAPVATWRTSSDKFFMVMEVGTRQILHWNITDHPTAEWTAQQFRMVVLGDQSHRFVVHDRDSIYSEGVDRTLPRWD